MLPATHHSRSRSVLSGMGGTCAAPPSVVRLQAPLGKGSKGSGAFGSLWRLWAPLAPLGWRLWIGGAFGAFGLAPLDQWRL